MSDSEYLKMVEIPVQTCDVVIKPARRKKKDVKEEVIEKINGETGEVAPVKRVVPKFASFYAKKNKNVEADAKRVKRQVVESEGETVSVRSSKFDIVSVQVVAIFVLIVGIILTNIFWDDSGINNLLRSVFKQEEIVNSATYNSFTVNSPTKTGEVTLESGVMTVSSGSVYSPCDGVVESVNEVDGKYVMTIRHSDSFTTVCSGLEFCYAKVGDNVFNSVALGFSNESINVSMFNENSLLTQYVLEEDKIVWLV